MKVKIRGRDSDFLNSLLDGNDYDVLVGNDANGEEVYTGDVIINSETGGEYVVNLSLDLNYLPFEAAVSNFKLKKNILQI